MPVYVSFIRITEEGNKEIKNARERYEAGRKNVERAGGKIIAGYYLASRGEYLVITEFPDEGSRIKSMINSVRGGTTRHRLCSALPVEEFFKLVDEA